MSELSSCCLPTGCLSAAPHSDRSLGYRWYQEDGGYWYLHSLPRVSVPNSPGHQLHGFPSQDQAAPSDPPSSLQPLGACFVTAQLQGAPPHWPFPTFQQGKTKNWKNMWELGFIYAIRKNNLITLFLNFLLKYSLFTMIQSYSKEILFYYIYVCVYVCVYIYIYSFSDSFPL